MEEMDKDKSQDMTSNSSEDSREKEDVSKNVETKSEEENNKNNSETASDEASSDPQNTGEINKTEKPKTHSLAERGACAGLAALRLRKRCIGTAFVFQHRSGLRARRFRFSARAGTAARRDGAALFRHRRQPDS